MNEYRICRKCHVPHYENCGTCFGFGVLEGMWSPGVTPIPAKLAFALSRMEQGTIYGREPLPCPECGSTINGIPDGDDDE